MPLYSHNRLLWLVLWSTVNIIPLAEASLTERDTLELFWESTYGTQWTNSNGWGSTDPICSWFGVVCQDVELGTPTTTADSGVMIIHLPHNNIAHSIPPNLYQMPNLQEITLTDNEITDAGFQGLDPAFSQTGETAPLKIVSMDNNFLTHVNGLEHAADTLQELKLSNNRLEAFPTEIYAMTQLERLYMNNNEDTMTGMLGTEIGQLVNLQELYAYGNRLTGQIPTEIGKMNKLEVLSLSSNLLSGSLPIEMNLMRNLQVLSLHGSSELLSTEDDNEPGMALTGSIPSFADTPRLSKLFLSNNRFSGHLPHDFMKHNILTHQSVLINLQNNELEGAIPVSLWKFDALHINLVNNRMVDDIPDVLCTKAQWMHGLVALYDCDAILCPRGTFSATGQQTTDDTPCQPCPLVTGAVKPTYYMGSTACPGVDDGSGGGTNPGDDDDDDDGLPSNDETARILLEFYLSLDGQRWEKNDGWEIFDSLIGKYQPLPGGGLNNIQIPFSNLEYCSFHGVICDLQGHIQFLTLSDNRLHGTFPNRIFLLPNLVSLDLSYNHIEVNDWSLIQNAKSLTRLKFSHTQVHSLEGIGKAKDSLENLFLDGVELIGSLPPELFELTLLQTLQLEASDASGNLDSKIGELTSLRRLGLHENQLGGQIPSDLNRLTNLEYLDLSDNDWTGQLPPDFLDDCDKLLEFRLNGARDDFGGPLPSFRGLKSITVLEMAYNKFSGPIPNDFLLAARTTEVSTNRDQIIIDLGGNSLNGPIPVSFQDFDKPLIIKAQDNEITDVPDVLCQQDDWMGYLVGLFGCDAILCEPGSFNSRGRASNDLSCDPCPGNTFWGQTICSDNAPVTNPEREVLDELFTATGGRFWNKTGSDFSEWLDPNAPICSREGVFCYGGDQDDSDVSELRLDRLGLRGTVPTSVFSLPSLRRLAVTRNPVELSFEGIENAQALEVIMASFTKVQNLTGVGQAGPKMFSIHLNDCGITGSIPLELLQVTSLRNLLLHGNKLSGSIPHGWGSLSDLESISMYDNDLVGQVPSSMGKLEALSELDLSLNLLSGPLPVEMQNMVSLTKLNLAAQRGTDKLSGPLLSFSNCTSLEEMDLSGNQFAGSLPPNFLENKVISNQTLYVDLSRNQFVGAIPIEWNSFESMMLDLAANQISEVDSSFCTNTGWRQAVQFDDPSQPTTCDWLLCPPGTYSENGWATTTLGCEPCTGGDEALYFGSISCNAEPTEDQRSALIDFYEATTGDEWVHNDNWGSSKGICTWYGVVCKDDLTVVELRLENNGLADVDSKDPIGALASLESLRLLDLKGNSVSLDFTSLAQGSPLEVLRVSKTDVRSLSGIERAQGLTSLHAMDNAMTGPFPVNVLQLPELTELYLSFNKFNGTFPSTVSSLAKLEEMYLYDNELTGEIPDSIGDMQSLRQVVLGENFFVGPIPSSLSDLANLEQLSLQSQKGRELITGPLPSFTGAPKLWYLDISNNKIGPTIPADFLAGSQQMSEAVTLLMRSNSFSGSIPPSLSSFEKLFLDLADNYITAIPSSLCGISGWMNGAVGEIQNCDSILCPVGYYSDLGRQDVKERPCIKCEIETNAFLGQTTCRADDSERSTLKRLFEETGGSNWDKKKNWGTEAPICSWEGISCTGDAQDDDGVETLNLASNNLQGTLTTLIYSLPSLTELGLRDNTNLTVSLVGLKNAGDTLKVLEVSYTILKDLQELQQAKELSEFYADRCGLTGGFPTELFELQKLETIHMNWNYFVGELPSEIGSSLPKLKTLLLKGNDFHGPVPSSIGYLSELEELVLDENLISGFLPATELSFLPRLRHLSIVRQAKAGRKITGGLPMFDHLAELETLSLDGNSISGTISENFLGSSVRIQEAILDYNKLVGGVPSSLGALEELHFSAAANQLTEVPEDFCEVNGQARTVASYFNSSAEGFNECDGLMCAPGSANDFGKAIDLNNKCEQCGDGEAPFFGSVRCGKPVDELAILVELFQELDGSQWTRNDYWLSSTSFCNWYGIVCDSGSVIGINLVENELKGTVPQSIYQLPNLQLLWLSINQIKITFDQISDAANLLDLRMESTGLRNVDGIGSAKSLTALSISTNEVEGPFPNEIMKLENLRFLSMNNNVFTGQIPEAASSFPFLRVLRMDNNHFDGNLPSFAESRSLMELSLVGNDLTGEIPHDFLQAIPSSSNIKVDLSSNGLSGTIPVELERLDKLSISAKQNQISGVPTVLCQKDEWNGGDVGKYGCDGLLCAPGTSTIDGRQTDSGRCAVCPEADQDHYGQALCESAKASSSSPLFGRWATRTCVLSFLVALVGVCS